MQEKNIGYELITLGHMLKRERDRANEDVKNRVLGPDNNVLCTDLGIIQYLADNDGREIYQKDIEKFLSLTAPSVSNKLRDLTKKGLVTRAYSEVDTRLKQVVLTPSALDIDKSMRDEIKNFENRLSAILTDEETQQLLMIVEKLKKDFD